MAGHVEAVGENVKRFRPGDGVFGLCGGTSAEYACAPEGHFATKPPNLTLKQAAAVPTAASFWDCRRALTPEGTLLPNTGHAGMGYIILAFALSVLARQHGHMFMARANTDDLLLLKDLIEAGKTAPVIGKEYPLSEAREALAYVGKGHTRGKVVIIM